MHRVSHTHLRQLLWVPLVCAVLASVLINLSNLDLNFSARVFDFETRSWYGQDSEICKWVYANGPKAALLLGVSGLFIFILSWRNRPRNATPRATYLALCVIVGPGLLVNATFKDNFGRPRPRDTIAFGGSDQFLPVGEIGPLAHRKSFPSGHASMGFVLAAPALFFGPRRRRIFYAWVCLGVASGIGIGLVRIAQGGHWFSDVLWSAVFVYYAMLAAGLLTKQILPIPDPYRPFSSPNYSRLPSSPSALS
ncbi:MAG: phosphatase PAP2 family protein [Puniceicoccaceae bacterium]